MQISIRTTAKFRDWLRDLSDIKAKASILARVKRASHGNFGDVKALKDGVFEMRIDIGKGYRVYYAREGQAVYLLITGGDKSTQKRDINSAKEMWVAIQEGEQL